MFRAKLETKEIVELARSKRDLLRRDRGGVGIDDSRNKLATGGFKDELGGALTGPIADVGIGAAFEPVGRFSTEVELLRGGPDVLRFEAGAFNQNVARVDIYLRVLTAHDTGKRDRFGFIGNQKHLAGEGVFSGVEGLEFFAFRGATDDDRRRNGVMRM